MCRARFEPPQDGDSDPAGVNHPTEDLRLSGIHPRLGTIPARRMGGAAQDSEEPISMTVATLWTWCRANRHQPMQEQHQKLSQKLRGHDATTESPATFPPLCLSERGSQGLEARLSQRDRTGMTWATTNACRVVTASHLCGWSGSAELRSDW